MPKENYQISYIEDDELFVIEFSLPTESSVSDAFRKGKRITDWIKESHESDKIELLGISKIEQSEVALSDKALENLTEAIYSPKVSAATGEAHLDEMIATFGALEAVEKAKVSSSGVTITQCQKRSNSGL